MQIEPIQINSDGSLPELPNQPNVAYWIDGTDRIFMFILSATPKNRALANSLVEESIAEAVWSSCTSMRFILSAPQPGRFEAIYLPDQSTASIQIFIQPDVSSEGIVINGAELDG